MLFPSIKFLGPKMHKFDGWTMHGPKIFIEGNSNHKMSFYLFVKLKIPLLNLLNTLSHALQNLGLFQLDSI